jgi:hypothetical protein
MSITHDCKANRLFTRLTLRGLKIYVHIGGRPWRCIYRRETMAGTWGDWMDSVIDTCLATGSARALMHVLARALTHTPLVRIFVACTLP